MVVSIRQSVSFFFSFNKVDVFFSIREMERRQAMVVDLSKSTILVIWNSISLTSRKKTTLEKKKT